MSKVKVELILEKFYHYEKTQADKVFLKQPVDGTWHNLTWKQVGQEARKLAQKIRDMNFPAGSCIGLLSKNCAHWMISDLAILMAGHISVPLYPTLHKDTISYILDHCDAKLCIVGKLDDWPAQKDGVPADMPKVCFPFWKNEGCTSWDEFIGDTKPMEGEHRPDPKDISTMIYTSGTTGKPKGVVHTYESMCYQINIAVKVFDLNSTDRFFSYLPLAHVAERLLVELGSIYGGATVSFAESLDTFAKNLAETKPTIFLAVPRIWLKFQQGILGKLPQKKLDLFLKVPILSGFIKNKIISGLGLSDVRYTFTGAAAISHDLLLWFDKLGITIQDCYGMTENFAVTTINQPGKVRYGTAGTRFGPDAEVKIAETGEILTRSPAVMVEYYKRPDATAETVDSDGWLHTGDKGEFSDDGYLKITGRVKDLFKTSKGKYVAPTAIEGHFSMCDLLDQVCVVGDGLPQPLALAVLSEEGKKVSKAELTEQLTEFTNQVNTKIENFERLNNMVIVSDEWSIETGLMTPTLKLKRNLVEDKYKANFESWYNTKEFVQYV